VGTAWHLVLIPNGRPLSGELPMGAIAVWVPCIMVIITCLVLCIDHIVRRQPLRQESQPPSEIL
jgi:polyferredoxin